MNRELQQQIRRQLETIGADDPKEKFDPAQEAERRITFLAEQLIATKTNGYVLGISGGIDSTLGGRLAQLACQRVRETQNQDVIFTAMRLPYGIQADETDAQSALDFIQPDEILTVNIEPSVTAMWRSLKEAEMTFAPNANPDFVKGNIKARARMIAQFTVAGATSKLVIGTDHAAEALVGFYTKFGDGAADLTPLTGLSKSQIKATAAWLGAPRQLVEKIPTADLEDNKPLLADEIALGVSYHDIDAYLAGEQISAEAEEKIISWYQRSAHKRAMPLTPKTWESRSGLREK